MGGRVTPRSRPDKGGVFTLWLREAASEPRSERRPDIETESLAGRRILIVDDDPRCAAAMRQEFVDQGAVAAARAADSRVGAVGENVWRATASGGRCASDL